MATITSTGVGSGLDINSIVTSLMAIEQRPLTLLQQRASSIQTKISAFGTLQSQIATLGDVATRLKTPATWGVMSADSSDSAKVSVTAGTSATAGAYSIAVTQLAQAQSLASSPILVADEADMGTGTLSISKGAGTPVSVVITDANKSLAGVRDAINSANAGVSASIVRDTAGARLVLKSTTSGADSAITVTAADGTGTPVTSPTGLGRLAYQASAPVGNGRNLVQTQAAQNAEYTVNGLSLSSSSNTITTALDGVTLTLKGVTTVPVDVGVSVETFSLRKNVNDFVKAYNDLNKLLTDQTRADPNGKSNGVLQGDSTAVTLLTRLRETLRGSVTGLSGANSLNAAGLELQRDGSLKVNETKFAPLLADPKQLSALFSQAQQGTDASSRGFGVRFAAFSSALTDAATGIPTRTESLQQSIKYNQRQQETTQDRLTRIEARIRGQYQRLDTEMTRLNSQMSFITAKFGSTSA
jgi:flagellar hook-associated protein 2